MTTEGERFAEAIANRDRDALTALFAEDVDFTALTPRRTWQAGSPDEVVDIVFGNWFEESDHIESTSAAEGESAADTRHVGYRFAITNPDGPHVVAQQAFYRTEGDAIAWMRIVCSGYRPRD